MSDLMTVLKKKNTVSAFLSQRTIFSAACCAMLLSLTVNVFNASQPILCLLLKKKLIVKVIENVDLFQTYLFFPEKVLLLTSYVFTVAVFGVGCLFFVRLATREDGILKSTFFDLPHLIFYVCLAVVSLFVILPGWPVLMLMLWTVPPLLRLYSERRFYLAAGACVLCSLVWFGRVFFYEKPFVLNSWYGHPETYRFSDAAGKSAEADSWKKFVHIEPYVIDENKVDIDSFFYGRIGCKRGNDSRNELRPAAQPGLRRRWLRNLTFPGTLETEEYWQHADRFVFHHHNFLLGAANEMALGRPREEINMQYGLGNTVLIQKILSGLGCFDYLHYFRLLFGSYFVYFFGMCLIFLFLTGDRKAALCLLLCQLTILQLQGWPFTLVAPGLAPGRHFFDVLTPAALYVMLRRKRLPGQMVFGLLFLLSLLLNLWQDASFGLLIGGASLGALFFLWFSGRAGVGKTGLAFGVCALLTAAGFLAFKTKNVLGPYYLMGLVGLPEILPLAVFAIAVFSLMLLTALYYLPRLRQCEAGVVLFCVLYCFALLTYYLWSSDPWHFLHCCPFFCFAGLYWFEVIRPHVPENIRAHAGKGVPLLHLLLLAAFAGSFAVQLYTYCNNVLAVKKWGFGKFCG